MRKASSSTSSRLSSLRDLELHARTTVEGLRQGLHRSPFHGFSAEFSQYRHYRPGDDLKYVDWKAFARTDRLYSRQFRETTNLGAQLVIDVSRSMAFPAQGESKMALAQTVAAVLATLIVDQGDAAGVLAVMSETPHGTVYVPARSGRHHLRVCLAAIAGLRGEGRVPIAAALRRTATVLRRRGLIILISDLYEEDSALTEIRRLARMGHDVVVIHVLAPAELDLPAAGAAEFEDLETGARLVTNPGAVRAEYREAISAFVARVEHAVHRERLDYLRLITGAPLEPSLRRFLIARRGGA
jgi:uncharacterized protein (DUF58 family)